MNAGTAAAVTISYDGDGNRVSKSVGGVTTRYLVDDLNPTGYSQVVEELTVVSGQPSVARVYVYGNDLISQQQIISGNWLASFYGYDGHGSVRLLTDSSGSLTDTYTYDAFGILINQTGTTPNDYLYAGEQRDSQLGLDYLRARYMNPASGRFWSRDEYEGSIRDPLSLHKYLYANADPANKVDPSGYDTLVGTLAGFPVRATINVLSTIRNIAIAAAIVCTLDNIASTILNETEGFEPGTPCAPPQGPRIKLYRGVNEKHAAYADAQRGIAKPNRRWWQIWKGPPTTPYEHSHTQDATLNSIFTSWTTDIRVAENYALRDQNVEHTVSRGVILEADIPIRKTYPSPPHHNIWHVTRKIELPESEVLVRGVVRGARVIRVP